MPVKEHLENARRLSDRATGISLVLFAGLLVSVQSDFRPKRDTMRDARVAERAARIAGPLAKSRDRDRPRLDRAAAIQREEATVDRLTKQRDSLTGRRERANGRTAIALSDSLRRTNRQLDAAQQTLKEILVVYQRMTRNAAALTVVRDAQRRAAQDVRLKGFGFELGVRGQWASVAWLSLFWLGLLNLAVARFGAAAEVRETGAGTADEVGTLRLPIWVRPVASGSSYPTWRAFDMFDTLGVGVVCLTVLCTVFAVWMAWLTLVAPRLVAPEHSGGAVVAPIAVAILAAAILFTLGTWLVRARFVETGQSSPFTPRRSFLIGVAVTAAGLSVLLTRPFMRFALEARLLSPRNRQRRRSAQFAPGFYQQKRSRTIHFVPGEGRAKSLIGVSRSDLVRLDPSILAPEHEPWIHSSARIPYARQVTKNLKKDYRTAAVVLVAMLERASPDHSTPLAPLPAEGSEPGASGPPDVRPRDRGLQARTHGQRRRRRAHRGPRPGKDRSRRDKLVQVSDLLARIAARANSRDLLTPAREHLFVLVNSGANSARRRNFLEHSQEMVDGLESRALPQSRFSVRRFEAALLRVEDRATRAKAEADLLKRLKDQPQIASSVERAEDRLRDRVDKWGSARWFSQFNRKVRLTRNRKKRNR